MIKITCLHPIDQKVDIVVVDKEGAKYQQCNRSSKMTECYIDNDGVQNIIIEQFSLIRKWYWWIRFFNPWFFIQMIVFRRFDYIGIDGGCAQIEKTQTHLEGYPQIIHSTSQFGK